MSLRYDQRAAAHAASRDSRLRVSLYISRLRLVTFLPGAACLLWIGVRGASLVVAVSAAALLCAFAVLVVWHARVEDRAAWFEALRIVNVRAHARTRREWDGLPPADPPARVDLAHHPYAVDLDLFGRASLVQWLGPSATPAGAAVLAAWLLEPDSVGEIRERQAAAAELAPASAWRERLAAHGVLAAAAGAEDLDRLFAWAEGPPRFGRVWLHVAINALTAAIWFLILLHATAMIDRALWMIPVVAGLILSFATAGRIQTAFSHAGAGQRALAQYAPLFEHAAAAPSQSAHLSDLQKRLTAEDHSAPRCMRQLNRILGFAELRAGAAILHFPIQAFTLWDFHVAFALDRWRRRVGRRVRTWMVALGELDALGTLGTVAFDNPSWCMPDFSTNASMSAAALGHPLIPDERRVTNDVEIGPPGTVLLVTGSNMSGKSTLLRAVGLNVVLAQAGTAACATAFRLPATDLQASIRVQDSLELGVSYFMAALERLKGIVDRAEAPRAGRTLLYLLDEILQGTNSAERSIAVRGIVRHLLQAGAIGAMTTHDLALALQPPLDRAARLVHFTESIDGTGRMSFDYRLRPGLATSRNALRLMQLIGINLLPDDAP